MEKLTAKQRLKLFWWFGGFLRVSESHLIQCQLDATSVDLETPVRNMLRGFASSGALRQHMQDLITGQAATQEFLSWLESEVLAEATEK